MLHRDKPLEIWTFELVLQLNLFYKRGKRFLLFLFFLFIRCMSVRFIRIVDNCCGKKLESCQKNNHAIDENECVPDISFTLRTTHVAHRTYVIREPLDSKITKALTWYGLTETSGNRISVSCHVRVSQRKAIPYLTWEMRWDTERFH